MNQLGVKPGASEISLEQASGPKAFRDAFELALLSPSHQVAEVISRIYQRGLTTTSGGNVSMKDPEGSIWITPSGVDKGELTPEDIMQALSDGTVVGPHTPSVELPVHKLIYDTRPDIKAVVHAHSPYLSAFSLHNDLKLDTSIIRHARNVCGEVGFALYDTPGTAGLSEQIAKVFNDNFNIALMQSHGIIVGAHSLSSGLQIFENLEFCAKTAIKGLSLGEVNYLQDSQIEAFYNQYSDPLDENSSVEHPARERELREEICYWIKRSLRQGLMISSYGTASARWNNDDFLITPSGVSRWDLEPKDMVQIKDGKREPGKIPSLSTRIHAEIYKRNPDINSIFITQSPNVMAFAVTGTELNANIIPECWLILQDPTLVPFETLLEGPEAVAETMSSESPVSIVCNDSVIVSGTSMEKAFDRLEVADNAAKVLLETGPLGKPRDISAEDIERLRNKFMS